MGQRESLFTDEGRWRRPLGTSAGHYLRTIDRRVGFGNTHARTHIHIHLHIKTDTLPHHDQDCTGCKGERDECVEDCSGENGNSFTSAGFIFLSNTTKRYSYRRVPKLCVYVYYDLQSSLFNHSSPVPVSHHVNRIQFPSL